MAKWSSPEVARDVLAHLRAHADDDGEVTVSLPALAEAVGVSASSAYRAVRRLIETRQIKVARLGTSNRYPSRYRLEQRAAALQPAALQPAG